MILYAAGHFRPQIEAALAGFTLGHAKELGILAVVVTAGVAYPVLLLLSGGITRTELKAAVRRGG